MGCIRMRALPCVLGGVAYDFRPFAIHHLRHASVCGLEAQLETRLTAYFFPFPATTDVDNDCPLVQNAFFDFFQGQRCIACCRGMSSVPKAKTRETLLR